MVLNLLKYTLPGFLMQQINGYKEINKFRTCTILCPSKRNSKEL